VHPRLQWLVFTDLDGTLLDDGYQWEAARPALELLRAREIPVVLCTSKTRAEVLPLREDLGLRDPFIAENGGAAYIPRNYFPFALPTARVEAGFQVLELGTRYGDEGYEMASPQYAVERMERDTRVVDIHPAKFDLHFCQPPYRFYAYSMYTPKDAPAVPPEVVANIRIRARYAADGLLGVVRDGAPADFGLLDAVAPSLQETLDEAVRLGLIQRKDLDDRVSALRYSPEIRSLSARFKPFFGDRAAAGFSGLTAAERQVVTTLIGAVALSGMDDSRGRPLFPAVSANVELLTHLGLTAMSEDPARAHQARTALTRYAGMLRDLDLRALEEQPGNGQAEGPS